MAPKYIYLDQNKWIDLARSIVNPSKYSKYEEVAEKAQEKVELNEWVFPLSFVHFTETLNRADPQSRTRLATVMANFSKNNSILPYYEIEKDEFLNLFAQIHNKNKIAQIMPIRCTLFHALGADLGISFKEGIEPNLEKAIVETFEEIKADEQLYSKVMQAANSQEFVKDESEYDNQVLIEWEKLQTELSAVPKEYKYKKFVIYSFLRRFALYNETLKKIFNKSKEEIIPDSILESEESTLVFLESAPSLNVRTKLMFDIFKNCQRKIQLHDNRDISFLSTAIPYCDVVITERTWKHSATVQKLDKKYSTIIENDLKYLLEL